MPILLLGARAKRGPSVSAAGAAATATTTEKCASPRRGALNALSLPFPRGSEPFFSQPTAAAFAEATTAAATASATAATTAAATPHPLMVIGSPFLCSICPGIISKLYVSKLKTGWL